MKKKALVVSFISEIRLGKYQKKKQVTTIVDADDKNCLAQLTVALKLNQGVRQWLSR
jgi:hypothetical protein